MVGADHIVSANALAEEGGAGVVVPGEAEDAEGREEAVVRRHCGGW